MTVPLPTYLDQLDESGVLTRTEIDDVLTGSDPPPETSEDLARVLVERHMLTKFQARIIGRGKGHRLRYGKYLVLDQIGAGGMGEVFLATHQHLKRRAALKLLPVKMMSKPNAQQRFLREIESLARLRHPNIVDVYDADTHRGRLYCVMEYVEGSDLSRLVRKQGPLSPARAVDYITQAARGLAAAHAADIIHRDVKPSNLLVDSTGTVKVLDLGLALVEAGSSEDGQLTRKGYALGSVDYMAPEQSLDAHCVDARTDIYSLGCTLYYLLAGQPPYSGDGNVERMLAHHQQPLPSLNEVCPGVSPELDRVFGRMIAKDPNDRLQTMTDVARALEAVQPQLGSDTSPNPAWDRTPELDRPSESADNSGDPFDGLLSASGSLIDSQEQSTSSLLESRDRLKRRSGDTRWLIGAVATAVLALCVILVAKGILVPDGRIVLEFAAPPPANAVILLDDVQVAQIEDGRTRYTLDAPADGELHRIRVESDGETLYHGELSVSENQTVYVHP